MWTVRSTAGGVEKINASAVTRGQTSSSSEIRRPRGVSLRGHELRRRCRLVDLSRRRGQRNETRERLRPRRPHRRNLHLPGWRARREDARDDADRKALATPGIFTRPASSPEPSATRTGTRRSTSGGSIRHRINPSVRSSTPTWTGTVTPIRARRSTCAVKTAVMCRQSVQRTRRLRARRSTRPIRMACRPRSSRSPRPARKDPRSEAVSVQSRVSAFGRRRRALGVVVRAAADRRRPPRRVADRDVVSRDMPALRKTINRAVRLPEVGPIAEVVESSGPGAIDAEQFRRVFRNPRRG